MKAVCTVAKMLMRFVCARRPGRPRQRFQHAAMEIGFTSIANPSGDRKRISIPDSSASLASAILLSQEFTHLSGTLVTDIPPEAIGEKNPSFQLVVVQDQGLPAAHGHLARR